LAFVRKECTSQLAADFASHSVTGIYLKILCNVPANAGFKDSLKYLPVFLQHTSPAGVKDCFQFSVHVPACAGWCLFLFFGSVAALRLKGAD
jgi:hypothetical protein